MSSEATADEPVTVPPPRPPEKIDNRQAWIALLQVLILLFIFLIGVRGLGTGFKGLGKDLLDSFFAATSNPFMGLVVGILATTLVQSSSVTTAMIVALVAAPDSGLTVENAVPMIMGANIGTTVTNTVVSLAHVGRPVEFKRAFSTATCHDFFNFMAVTVLLPLEIATGFLRKAAGSIATAVGSGGPGKMPNPIKSGTKAALAPLQDVLKALSDTKQIQAVLLILVSAVIIFVALLLIVRTLRRLAETRLKTYITRSLGANAYVGMVVGIIVTVMVQSSSITTSVLVPLAAAGLITLPQAFPITLGANIGTTVTALLASMAAPAETAHLAVQIAAVHLLFNMAGILLIYPLEPIRRIPIRAAEWLADVAVNNKKHALFYVVGLFYGLPGLLILITRYA